MTTWDDPETAQSVVDRARRRARVDALHDIDRLRGTAVAKGRDQAERLIHTSLRRPGAQTVRRNPAGGLLRDWYTTVYTAELDATLTGAGTVPGAAEVEQTTTELHQRTPQRDAKEAFRAVALLYRLAREDAAVVAVTVYDELNGDAPNRAARYTDPMSTLRKPTRSGYLNVRVRPAGTRTRKDGTSATVFEVDADDIGVSLGQTIASYTKDAVGGVPQLGGIRHGAPVRAAWLGPPGIWIAAGSGGSTSPRGTIDHSFGRGQLPEAGLPHEHGNEQPGNESSDEPGDHALEPGVASHPSRAATCSAQPVTESLPPPCAKDATPILLQTDRDQLAGRTVLIAHVASPQSVLPGRHMSGRTADSGTAPTRRIFTVPLI